MHAEQVREVPMLWVLFGEILRPFLKLPATANLIWYKFGSRCANAIHERCVDAKCARGVYGVREEIPDQCAIHRGTGAERSGAAVALLELQLRRRRWRRHEKPLLVGNQKIQIELGR